MKMIVKMMHNNSEKLPLEYPIKEALKIYGRRFFIFSIVVAANLVFLGFILSALNFPVLLVPVLIAISIGLFILFKRRKQSTLQTLLKDVQESSEVSQEDFCDAIIALLLKENLEEAKTVGLSNESIEFIKELKKQALKLCIISERHRK